MSLRGSRPGDAAASSRALRSADSGLAALARRQAAVLGVVTALVLGAGAVRAQPTLGPGDVLAPLALEDQHGRPRAIDAGVRGILFSRDMGGGGVAKEALAEDGAALLEASGTVYVADISRMPGLVTKLFALPGMRRRPYPMLLDRDGAATSAWPSEEGHASLIGLRDGVVTDVRTFDDAPALRQALEVMATPASVEDQLRGAEERRFIALVRADRDALEEILADDLVYTHSDGRTQSREDLVGSLVDGHIRYRHIDGQIEHVSPVGEAAVVTGRAQLGVEAAGRPVDLVVRYLAVYARRDGRWQLVAYQSTELRAP